MLELVTALCAAVGALTLALLGWLSSNESFDIRKFIGSAITAIVAGVGVAVAADYGAGLSVAGCMLAFLAGVGADAGRKAVARGLPAKQSRT
jgi:hypothetical protein